MKQQISYRSTLLRDRYSTIALFLAPAALVIVFFILYPIFSSFQLSFTGWNGLSPDKIWIGTANWRELCTDRVFLSSIVNNLKVVVLSIVFQIPFALLLAVLLDIGGNKFKIFKTVYFFPMLMSTVAIGILFKYIYDPQFGMINQLLTAAGLGGLAQSWLGNPRIALYAVIAIICWQNIPFYMVYFLAAMTSIPADLYEAACIDGATRSQYFWNILLPLLSGSIKSAMILSMVGSLKYFDLVFVITDGGPMHATELMATYMYKNAFTNLRMGYGSAVSIALFVIVMVVSVSVNTLTRRKEG